MPVSRDALGARLRFFVLAAAIVAAGFVFGQKAAFAQPQLPATFYGTASIDGKPVPDGTDVRGFIDGMDCTQGGPTHQGTVTDDTLSDYVIEVVHASQTPGCGGQGKMVTFTIGGRTAAQTVAWQAGPQHIDLNAGTGEPAPLPTVTPTATVAPAQLADTATAAANLTPGVAGTLPTDDVQLPGTTLPGAAGTPTPHLPDSVQGEPLDTSSNGGPPIVLIIVAVLIGIGVVAGGAGFALSRRGKAGPGGPEPPGPPE
ncbi:MAG: hypothetical protein ACRDG3_03320 [Tepidiformaceae bacterium]